MLEECESSLEINPDSESVSEPESDCSIDSDSGGLNKNDANESERRPKGCAKAAQKETYSKLQNGSLQKLASRDEILERSIG